MALEQTALLWLGTLALGLEMVGLKWAVPRYRDGLASLEGLIAYAFAVALWGSFTLTSLGYRAITDGGIVISRSSQTLMLLGLLGLASSVILLFDAAFRVIKSA